MYTLPLAYLVDCGNPYLRQWGESRQQWEDRNKEQSKSLSLTSSLALHLLTDGNLFSGLFHLWAIWDTNKTSLAHFVFFLSDGEPRFFLSSEALVDRQDSAPRSAFLTQIGIWESWPRFPWHLFLRSKESCVQGGSLPKSVCWKLRSQVYGLGGGCQLPPFIAFGVQGEKRTGCPISMWS